MPLPLLPWGPGRLELGSDGNERLSTSSPNNVLRPQVALDPLNANPLVTLRQLGAKEWHSIENRMWML